MNTEFLSSYSKACIICGASVPLMPHEPLDTPKVCKECSCTIKQLKK